MFHFFQEAMQKHGMPIPEELLDQLSDVLALQSSRRGEDSLVSQPASGLHASDAHNISTTDATRSSQQTSPPIHASGPAALYGDQHSASAGRFTAPGSSAQVPPNQLPPAHIHMQNAMAPPSPQQLAQHQYHVPGGMHASGGGQPAQPVLPAGLYNSMSSRLGRPGYAPPSNPAPGGMPSYAGQRDSDFAMAM